MAVTVPPDLATAGWVGTTLILALTLCLGLLAFVAGVAIKGAWLVVLLAAGAISLAIFTKGFRLAPAWALRASFVVLVIGLGLPVLILIANS